MIAFNCHQYKKEDHFFLVHKEFDIYSAGYRPASEKKDIDQEEMHW
jgi:hypothetical protein